MAYSYNAKKSAIMFFGETKHESKVNSKFRVFIPGKEKIAEIASYDHVGVKACLYKDYSQRVDEKISKGVLT